MSDNNSSGKFVSADTTKIANFEKQSAEVITEFATIKNEFNRINKELLASWKGVGADAYSTEIAHILEKIGSVEDVLKAINESAVKDIRDSYSQVDDELGEFNRNPNSGTEEYKWLILQMLSLPVTKRIQHQILSFLKN